MSRNNDAHNLVIDAFGLHLMSMVLSVEGASPTTSSTARRSGFSVCVCDGAASDYSIISARAERVALRKWLKTMTLGLMLTALLAGLKPNPAVLVKADEPPAR